MKKLALVSLAALAASSVVLLAHAGTTVKRVQPLVTERQEKDRFEAPDCSNETLEGTYGVSFSGTRPAPPPPSGTPSYVPGTIENVIGLATQTFDGNGNFTQIDNVKGSLSGIVAPNRSGQGTYAVNPDCSGTTTVNNPGVPFPIVNDFLIVGHGSEFRSIVASPQAVMVSANGRKED